jgi:hypothetical protein
MECNGTGEHVLGTSYSSRYFRQFVFIIYNVYPPPLTNPPLPNKIMNGIWTPYQGYW